ncbi:hypothetical protein SAMN04488044_1042 [Cognatishimia maritima]|uniref:Uncharacterized protein n=1 Tax=Cognatishimia maritima TaxID=870908 RepID=A0A1M5KR10_9RHOB|nr:hypothetical protein SAMN04488044_1042 [Cognatishimia maritima]
MPKSKKPARKRSAGLIVPKKPAVTSPKKPQPSDNWKGRSSQRARRGKPMLFPGRTGGR